MLVICNGMGRSGSTLQYNWARELVETAGVGVSHGFVAGDPEHSQGVPHEEIIGWAQDSAYHVMKIHTVHPVLPALLEDANGRVCYIYRDLRDVAVSMISTWGWRREKLASALEFEVNNYRELDSLRTRADRLFLWQRYEEVMVDPFGAVRQIAEFLDLSVDDEELSAVVDACSIEVARRIGAVQRHMVRTAIQQRRDADGASQAALSLEVLGRGQRDASMIMRDPRTELMYNHISRHEGQSDVWKRALPQAELDALMGQYKWWLEDAGYEV
jgi:hypothetical protein